MRGLVKLHRAADNEGLLDRVDHRQRPLDHSLYTIVLALVAGVPSIIPYGGPIISAVP